MQQIYVYTVLHSTHPSRRSYNCQQVILYLQRYVQILINLTCHANFAEKKFFWRGGGGREEGEGEDKAVQNDARL